MKTREVLAAVGLEVRAMLKPGWSMRHEQLVLIVEAPRGVEAAEFVDEVWRIARFVAYDDVVSIARESVPERSYRIHSSGGEELEFELVVRSSQLHERAQEPTS